MNKMLVTGATGNVGSVVVRELRRHGAPVRAVVRDRGKAAGMLGGDVELMTGDFADAASVRRAMEGVDGLFLACSNQPRQVEFENGLIDAARETGVSRIVKLSAHGAEIGSPVAFWDWHGRIEEHLAASGIPSVVLRPTFAMTNILGSVEQIQQAGSLFVPAADARVAMVDPRDIAAVVAIALTGGEHDGKTYTITGPEAITFERVAENLSIAAGRHIQFVPVPDDAAQQALIATGIPEFVAGQIVTIFGILRQGAQNLTTGVVRDVTGREPNSFARFANDYAQLFQAAA
jgi:uncharacterized protein YbjT (DUF2867 family)